MDEFNFSTPNVTSHEPRTNTYQTLPPELMLFIIQLLSQKDQQSFSFVSKSSRQLALPVLFRKLVCSRNVGYRIKRFNETGEDVKAAIRELEVIERGYRVLDHESILFPFLRSLPHLQSFRWSHFHRLARNPILHQLVACLRHSPLEHFTYWAPHQVSELVVTGPPRLKTLSVKFDNAHVYDLIRPSFSTLVELEIYPGSVVVDLLPLRPVGSTLRKFVYGGNGFDPDILDTISDVFPHLTTLELTVWNRSRDFRWKAAYDQALAKNSKLQYLAVFAEDFLFCDSDDRWAHLDSECRNCVDQRVKATRVLAMVCTGLKRCWWKNRHAQFRFVVRVSLEENTLGQVQSVLFTDLNKYDDDSNDIFIVLPSI